MTNPAHRQPLLWLWLCAGLGFLAFSLLQGDGQVSALWGLELVLYALMIVGLGRGGFDLTLPTGWATAAFLGLSWTFGMVYELTLTVDGTGFGGLHPDTWSSFVLAQGDYIPIAVATLWMVRRWHLTFAGAVWVACGKSLTEGIVFTGVLSSTILSPFWPIAPLMLAYYTLAYASFVALPLILLAPATLWSRHTDPTAKGALFLISAGFGAAMVIRVLWGLAFAPVLTWLFDLPPNPVP